MRYFHRLLHSACLSGHARYLIERSVIAAAERSGLDGIEQGTLYLDVPALARLCDWKAHAILRGLIRDRLLFTGTRNRVTYFIYLTPTDLPGEPWKLGADGICYPTESANV